MGNGFILTQTGWIQARHQVTRQLALDPTSLLTQSTIPHPKKQNFKVFNTADDIYNILLRNYPAFKGLILYSLAGHCFISEINMKQCKAPQIKQK